MEVMSVAKAIEARIQRLEKLCADLDKAGDTKAEAIMEYDKQLAIAIARLHRGKCPAMDTGGETPEPLPEKPPVMLIKKLAEGICSESRLALEQAKVRYTSLNTKIEALEATLSAKQSIFRHLDST